MFRLSFLFSILMMLLVASCESDYSYRGDINSLSFSADTLSFDTVFCGSASVTGRVMIYNKSERDITIDCIQLRGGEDSDFKVSINGMQGSQVQEQHLRSGDSLYVFVNVFPKTDTDNPYRIIEDDIIAIAGSNQWVAHLWACGLTANRVTGTLATNVQWTNEIPYLITDTFTIDASAKLTISEGTEIYMSNNAYINVQGTLVALGSLHSPVRIKSARLSSFYSDIPGQWNGIALTAPHANAQLIYTEVANATTALRADSSTTLILDNVEVRDAKYCAVDASVATLRVLNSVLYNCGSSLINVRGGDVEIGHCTLYNYFRWNTRSEATVTITAAEQDVLTSTFMMQNSVVVGNQINELSISDELTAQQCMISHCYVRLDDTHFADTDDRLEAVIKGKEPKFVNTDKHDFHLLPESPLVDKANADYTSQLPTDHDGVLRSADSPDIGAYELVVSEYIGN